MYLVYGFIKGNISAAFASPVEVWELHGQLRRKPVLALFVSMPNTRGTWLREFCLRAFDPVPSWWVPVRFQLGSAMFLCLPLSQFSYLWVRLAHRHNDVWSPGTIWKWHFQRRTVTPQKNKLGKHQSEDMKAVSACRSLLGRQYPKVQGWPVHHRTP